MGELHPDDERLKPASNANPWHSYDTVFLNAKAGMDGVDKERVQKVVYKMSKGSNFFKNEQRKEAMVQERIERLQAQAASISHNDLLTIKKTVDRRIAEVEASRDLSHIWVHVDMDAFYAAVETLEDPSLERKPMAVGSMSMICTANYEARKYGVRAAMPGFIAKELCPNLIFVKPNFEKYSYISELTHQVFQEYDRRFIARSLDEAYLDVTLVCQQSNLSGAEIAEQLRQKVQERTKLTCSAGVGPNRLLAKVCSDINKPNGQFVIPNSREDIMNFVSTLPIRKVSGIGKVTERLLKEVLDIRVCGDLIRKCYEIAALFSAASRDFFISVGLGIGGSDPPQDETRKSLSNERTFMATNDEAAFLRMIDSISESLEQDMAKEKLRGRTLTLKLKTATFQVRTRAISLHHYIDSKEEIRLYASKLLKSELPMSLRLIGLRISQFEGTSSGSVDPLQKTLSCFMQRESKPNVLDNSKELMQVEDPSNMEQGLRISEASEADVDKNGRCFKDRNNKTISCDLPFTIKCEDRQASTIDKLLSKFQNVVPCDGNIHKAMKCPLCGISVPNFIQQEHDDYHFALMLYRQDMEIESRLERPSSKRPCTGKGPHNAHAKKKPTSMADDHLPIDAYFARAP